MVCTTNQVAAAAPRLGGPTTNGGVDFCDFRNALCERVPRAYKGRLYWYGIPLTLALASTVKGEKNTWHAVCAELCSSWLSLATSWALNRNRSFENIELKTSS